MLRSLVSIFNFRISPSPIFHHYLPFCSSQFVSALLLKTHAAVGAFFQADAGGVVEAGFTFGDGRGGFFPALDHGLVEGFAVQVADKFAVAVMLAQADVAVGEDGHGGAAVGHTVVQLRLFRNAPCAEQAVFFESLVQSGHGGIPLVPFLAGVLLGHGAVAFEEVVGIDRQTVSSRKYLSNLLGQIQQILRVVQVQVQTDADGDPGIQKMTDVFQHDPIRIALPVDVSLDPVVDLLGAIQGDLDPF